MKITIILILLFIISGYAFGQTSKNIEFNKEYTNVNIDKSQDLNYVLKLDKGSLYSISVFQQGIDIKLVLTDESGKQILEHDSPNGQNGFERFECTPAETKKFNLKIVRLEQKGNPESGQVTIQIKKFTKRELQLRERIKKELETENQKTVITADIDHFWEAFDNLKNCKSSIDSINSFQSLYLDRATDGLIDFIAARQFSAEKFVDAVRGFPKFYNSVRENTYKVKNAVPLIEEIVAKFQQIYPNFKPSKICFAIGLINTGGTVSDKFLLIGTEVTTATKYNDLSEFNGSVYSKYLASGDSVVQKIKNMVAHEYVHTQQTKPYDENSIGCMLLYKSMKEGFCDFIGEIISGSQINSITHLYGDQHEKQLWQEFKNELCNSSDDNWLYNYSTVKDKPADLGYYIGYKIAEEYYKNATDKKQAIADIIEMNDPIKFLQISKYDQKEKQ
ncbi:MAG: DUF2268 domain-containing putative Zn-dependent protease [bacterium]